jgi:hypothetical protein
MPDSVALATSEALLATATAIYGAALPSKPLRVLQALPRVQAGEDLKALAKALGTTSKNVLAVAKAPDPVAAVFGTSLHDAITETGVKRARQNLGGLLIAELAERAFENIYKATMQTSDLNLKDDREARNDTDYLVINGGGKSVFRVNIKFHGSQFRNAKDLVGLDPSDCFALATYKIFQGIEKQKAEFFPYLFVIVGVPDLTGAVVGNVIPQQMVEFSAFVHAAKKAEGKRSVEEAIVRRMLADDQPSAIRNAVAGYGKRIAEATWYVLSARRADKLLRELLFDRVYGVRVRAFARNYGGAELDMHFSLSKDLTKLTDFLATLRNDGLTKVLGMLERGAM